MRVRVFKCVVTEKEKEGREREERVRGKERDRGREKVGETGREGEKGRDGGRVKGRRESPSVKCIVLWG